MSKRRIELEEYLSDCSVARMYVSAFLSFAGVQATRRVDRLGNILDMSVIAEAPYHMLHYNGETFLK